VEQHLYALGVAAITVFDPSRGDGPGETIIGLLLVAAFIAAVFIPHNSDMDTVLVALVSAVVAFYFGQKVTQYNKEKE